MQNEPQIIADIFHQTRGLTRWYLKKIPEEKMVLRPEFNGVQLNSAYWIQAHLCWAEAYLCIKSTGAEVPEIPWLNQFTLGSKPEQIKQEPSVQEVRDAFEQVHQLAMDHIRALDPESLGESSGLPMFPTRRIALYHAIRHEGTHTGHIGWICKLLGIPAV